MRFRGRSGNYRVAGNTFIDALADAAISDWYCEVDNREDCNKRECPSFGNTVVDKVVRRSKKESEVTKVYGADVASTGEPFVTVRSRAKKLSAL